MLNRYQTFIEQDYLAMDGKQGQNIMLSVIKNYIQNKLVFDHMLKKYDKLDLRSDNFKATKTPDKKQKDLFKTSQPNSSPFQSKLSSDKIDPNDLFQKVCCPNCRFIFKIIKNNELLLQRAVSKKSITHHALVQTQQMLVKDIKDMSKLSLQISQKHTPRHSQSSIFKTGLIKHNNISKSQMIKQPDHLQSSTYKFPEHSPFKNGNIRRLSYLNTSNKQDSSLFVNSKPALRSFEKSEAGDNSVNKQRLQQQQLARIKKQAREQIKRDLHQLPQLVTYALNNRNTIDNLISFYTDLPSSIDIPSYCKMLISDYEIKKSQPQKPFNLQRYSS